MALRASRGNVCSYWRHSRAEGPLPVDVGLDPVPVADVNGRSAGESGGRPVQGLETPGGHVVHVHVEGRLVELDDVDSGRHQIARLLVEDARERHGQGRPIPIVLVGQACPRSSWVREA